MKARIVPLYFIPGRDSGFDTQFKRLQTLLKEEIDFLRPVELGSKLPAAEAVVFPQLLGEAYSQWERIQRISLPKLVITSEFGTVSMWDWELVKYLDLKGIKTLCPTSLEQCKIICRGLVSRRKLKSSKFVVYQDDPAGPSGKQSEYFKRFYWFEKESYQNLTNKFGITIEKKSFKELGKAAKELPDSLAEQVLQNWKSRSKSIQGKPLLSAVKLYLALKKQKEADSSIIGMGLNCLNESGSCDTTPCLAWNLLYNEEKLIWGCEADTMSMMTEYIVDKTLRKPFLMSNLYPFLMGQAALKHERIPNFPEVDEPQNHILVAHCGYFGLLPEKFSTQWSLKERVLKMVDKNATVIDARIKTGKITLAKLQPFLNKISVVEGELTQYIQYENSDCLNGGVVRVQDGHKFVSQVSSHHYIIMEGHHRANFEILGKVFELEVETL